MPALIATLAATLLLAAPLAAQPTPAADEIAIELDSFGLQGLARPGDWAGIRLRVTDRADRPREVMVRLHLTDADGDHPTPTRVIATNPGVTQGVWLYLRLPNDAAGPFEVLANAAVQQEDGSYRPGRLLGTGIITPTGQLPPPACGLIAVLGSRFMQLNQYAETYQAQTYPPAAHERIIVAKDLSPDHLPDRWPGLAPYGAIVWTEGDPIGLSSERAQAVRDWVTRGGHLVVVLPRVGQTWMTNRNPLIDVLPDVTVTRADRVDLEPYRPLLTDRPPEVVALPDEATVHHLLPRDGAEPRHAAPILQGPDGRPVVVRRLVGLGAVTLVGIDVNDPQLVGAAALDPDVFWHRVLGRRGDLLTTREMTFLANQTGSARLNFPGRNTVAFDNAIDAQIAKTGRAAAGVLLGFVVFVLFWVVAGPGGFALLKASGRVKHAWLAYAGATALFTLIAWGGATAIRPSRVDATYLRMIDHVYAQPLQRARTWASVLIPSYGEATIAIGDPGADGSTNLIAPWRPPSGDGIAGGFPDARAYPILANDLDSITVPTRATVKQVIADWAGDPAWAMPIVLPPEGQDSGRVRLLTPAQRQAATVREGFTRPDLHGVLTHDLPAPLEDVVIVVVKGQEELRPPRTSLTRLPGGPLLARAHAYSRTTPWAPGQPLDLAEATSVPIQQQTADVGARAFLESLVPKGSPAGLPPRAADIPLTERLTALALYPMLEPPDPASRSAAATRPIVARTQTHGWDLGRWFTRPCVIIIGHIPDLRDEDDGPAPIYVDGQPAPMRGHTVVRWVYPLPPDPPAYPSIRPGRPPGPGADGPGG